MAKQSNYSSARLQEVILPQGVFRQRAPDADIFGDLAAMAETAFQLPMEAVERIQRQTTELTHKARLSAQLDQANALVTYLRSVMDTMSHTARMNMAKQLAEYFSSEISELEASGAIDSAWLRARNQAYAAESQTK